MLHDHFVAPQGTEETDILEQRILRLSTSVLTVAEWLALLAAAETLLPRRSRGLVPPVELDLIDLRSRSWMRLFAAVICAVASKETYRSNRRYGLSDWTAIVLKFSKLSMYVVPAASLSYAVELCLTALRSGSAEAAIRCVNALYTVDPRTVSQLVRTPKITEWSEWIQDTLEKLCSQAEEFRAASDAGEPYDADDYDGWREECRDIEEVATAFYGWSRVSESAKLSDLRLLIQITIRPPDRSYGDDDEQIDPGAATPSEYWTLERIFEDL